jgi:hypothetical protein
MRAVVRGEIDLERLGAAGIALAAGPLSAATALERLEALLERAGTSRKGTGWLDAPDADRHVVELADRVAAAVGVRIRADEHAWARSVAPTFVPRRGIARLLRRST